MSAEVENNKEEKKEEPANKKPPFRTRVLNSLTLGFKILEIIMSCVCMGCIYLPSQRTGMGKTYQHHVGVMYTAFMGSIVIALGFIVSRVLKDNIGYKTSFVFSVINSVLFIKTGIFLSVAKAELTKNEFFHPSRYLLELMIISIVFTFLNAIVFAADAIFSMVTKRDFMTQ